MFIKSQGKRDSFYFTSTKKNLRAYIIFVNNTFSYNLPKVNTKDYPIITLSYKNVGKTPANNIIPFVRYDVGVAPVDSLLFEKRINTMFPISLGENESSDQFRERHSRTFSRLDSIRVANKQEVIYWGFGIYYTDVFGEKHTLECVAGSYPSKKASILYYKRND